MFILSSALILDTRESLMPFVVNSLKVVDDHGARVSRAAMASVGAIVLGLAVAIPLTLWIQYDRGANMADRFATRAAPKLALVPARPALAQVLLVQALLVQA